MIKSFKAVAQGLLLLLATVSVCSAQDLQKGLEAAQKGDFATALREWRPLAAQGNASAQIGIVSLRAVAQMQDLQKGFAAYNAKGPLTCL